MPARRRNPLIAVAFAVAVGVLAAFAYRNAISEFLFVLLPRDLAEAGMPLGGERVLPPTVQHMIALLRRHEVERYRASPLIASDQYTGQRLLEGAWPIRRVADSPWYIAFATETLPSGCRSIDQQADAVLARCP